jgi:SAM-dependent methyltransferase
MHELISTEPRNCDICNSKDLETLFKYNKTVKTQNHLFSFEVNNTICKSCGFIFVSPVYKEKSLNKYYSDTFPRFNGQNEDFDAEKRIAVIDKFKSRATQILEIGANQKGIFFSKLNDKFRKVYTVEPGSSEGHNFKSISEIKETFDLIIHYFVLEHIPNPKDWLSKIVYLLNTDGVLIFEVPTIDLYSSFFEPLALYEHTNHFSCRKLEELCALVGLRLLYCSQNECSRPFGHVFVFCKNPEAQNGQMEIKDEYQSNKSYFLRGLEKYAEYEDVLANTADFVNRNPSKKGIIWCANLNSFNLFEKLKKNNLLHVIDSDPLKSNFFEQLDILVKTPECATVEINEAEYVIICSKIHERDILNAFRKIRNNEDKFKTLVI